MPVRILAPATVPHTVLAMDAWGSIFSWGEFWAADREGILEVLRDFFEIEPVYLRVVAL